MIKTACPHRSLPLAAKLFFSRSVDEAITEGFGGSDIALDSVEWCPMLHHNTHLYVAMEKWASEAFPELEVKLIVDEQTENNKNSCTVHLSWCLRK